VVAAGYGLTGDGNTSGFNATGVNLRTKRWGLNLASRYAVDDEAPHTAKEVFYWDFDQSGNLATDALGDGNQGASWGTFEITTGPGDSGSPSFVWNDTNTNHIIDKGELVLFGVNTLGASGITAPPLFGSLAGGMIISTYKPWILQQIVPEPTSLGLVACGALVLCGSIIHRQSPFRDAAVTESRLVPGVPAASTWRSETIGCHC
jgi:hypothetical protein